MGGGSEARRSMAQQPETEAAGLLYDRDLAASAACVTCWVPAQLPAMRS
jgi:hypothetical protein